MAVVGIRWPASSARVWYWATLPRRSALQDAATGSTRVGDRLNVLAIGHCEGCPGGQGAGATLKRVDKIF